MLISLTKLLPCLILMATRISSTTNLGNGAGKGNTQPGILAQESKSDNTQLDPFGLISMASRISRAAGPVYDDYSVENDKDEKNLNDDGFKGRKESDWQHHDEKGSDDGFKSRKESDWQQDKLNRSVTVDKSVRRQEHIHGDARTKTTNSGRDSRGEKRPLGRLDPRNSGRRNETGRRRSFEEDRKRFDDDRTSYSQDRRRYQDEERHSHENRRERGESRPSRRYPQRRGGRTDRPGRNPNGDRHQGRFVHRIVVTNKVLCPNCSTSLPHTNPHSPHPSTPSQNNQPYYYY